jgi:hypothetical protein
MGNLWPEALLTQTKHTKTMYIVIRIQTPLAYNPQSADLDAYIPRNDSETTVVHVSVESAQAEAERLALEHPGYNYYVFKALQYCHVDNGDPEPRWVILDTEAPAPYVPEPDPVEV